ncbi:hypothetical protein EJD97_000922 [Solanum chilense]|uniref:NAB domain-containing protein n=1 Tax=Solanum chilense TaxID=4083 RepID=A0A6N2AN34_SOLCI|nr:hypothetical protein EJD97_000922 [Solanum chilense]
MLKIIEDSNAESFDKKYSESRKELINLVVKCYKIHCSLAERHNDGATVLLNYIPNSDLIPSQSNVSSFKSSALPLSKFPSSKQPNHHEHKGSKQLKRGVSDKGINHHIKGKISKIGMAKCKLVQWEVAEYSDTQSDNDYEESDDELEAELRDMIETLYKELEGDRVVSNLQGETLRYGEFSNVKKESVSSKALLEENLEIQPETSRGLYTNEPCESLEEALIQARAEKIEAETEVERLKASIVKKNNHVQELNKILEAVMAERDQLKVRVAMLHDDPKSPK